MMLLYIVLGFLVPVIMVFVYSIWLNRKRRSSNTTELRGDSENKTFSALVQKCSDLRDSVIKDNAINIEEEIDSVLAIARSFRDQNLKDQSLAQVMAVYVAIGRDEEARTLLSEVKGETNRAHILKEVLRTVT